jgi:hypothetical protein
MDQFFNSVYSQQEPVKENENVQSLHDILNQQIVQPSLEQMQLLTQQMQQPLILPSSEEPLFVNSKQYHRILKRREARQRYEQQQQKTKFMHLSRHLHAKKRPRGPGGRFLSSAELEALKATNRIVDGQILARPEGPRNEHDLVLEKLDNEYRQLNNKQ